MACVAILKVNRVLRSGSFKLFSVIKALVAKSDMIIPGPRRKTFYRGMPSVFFGCQKFSMLALRMDFSLASWPICC